jgi:regulatory protein
MEENRAKDYAVWLLTQSPRSEKDIVDRLKKKECTEETIASVMEKLRAWGYLDDASLAERWVESRGRSRGKRLLSQELFRKGVDRETARTTLAERSTETEQTAARVAAVRKVGEQPIDKSREAQQRLSAFLARRGFGWDAIRPVLKELYQDPIDIDSDVESED